MGLSKKHRKLLDGKLNWRCNTKLTTKGGSVMDDLDKLLKELLNDSAFKKEHDKTRVDFELAKTIISARCEKNLTQKQLAHITGLRQSNISRIETGSCSPNVTTLQIIAEGLGKKLHIEFL